LEIGPSPSWIILCKQTPSPHGLSLCCTAPLSPHRLSLCCTAPLSPLRDSRKIPLNWEHRLMLGLAPDYDHLMVIQKVEVFEHALESTSGEDLHKVRGWAEVGGSKI